MSNRTIVELNHDYCPRDDAHELIEWALRMRYYMGNAESAYLPNGVTFLHYRHHSERCPLSPQQGRRNDSPGYPAWIRKHANRLIADAKVDLDAERDGAVASACERVATSKSPLPDAPKQEQ